MNTRKIRIGLIFCLAALATALGAASASAATAPATLRLPTHRSATSPRFFLDYILPEAAKAGTLTLTFQNSEGANTIIVLTSDGDAAGENRANLNLNELKAGTGNYEVEKENLLTHIRENEIGGSAISAVEGEENLADGVYSVTLSYQNEAGELAARTTATEVTLKSTTTPPELLSPTVSAEYEEKFEVEYSFPEFLTPIGFMLVFEDLTHSETPTLIKFGGHTPPSGKLTINLADPESIPGASVNGPDFRIGDTYSLRLAYQSYLGNPAAFSIASDTFTYAGFPDCTPGNYSASGHKPCVTAGAGYYAEGAGATTETPCEPGTYNPNEEATSASACIATSAGHYVSVSGAADQTECSPGHYVTTTHSFACLPADPGSYVDTSGASTETPCPAGTYNESGEEISCLVATAGHYVEEEGATFETPCELGTYNPNEESISSSACGAAEAGHYVEEVGASTEAMCELGTYNPDEESISSSSCLPAEAGHYVDHTGSATQAACPPGHYNPTARNFSCLTAVPGTYTNTSGATAATPCGPGSYSPDYGSDHCDPTPIGYHNPESEEYEPWPCLAGTYSGATGAINCTTTPADYFSADEASSPTACPAGTESAAGSSSCKAIPSKESPKETPKESPKETPKETPKESPKETPKAPEAPRTLECKVSAPTHQLSLLHKRKQAYTISCNLNTHLIAKSSVTISVGRKHLTLLAKPAEITVTGPETLNSTFKLTAAAKKMLKSHKARVALTVNAISTGSGHGLAGKGKINGHK